MRRFLERVACDVLPHPAHVGIRLVGELDVSNRGVLRRALTRLISESAEVHIDLGGLNFIDIGGMAELAAFARQYRPRRVVVENPSALIRRILGEVWEDCGLVFD